MICCGDCIYRYNEFCNLFDEITVLDNSCFMFTERGKEEVC